MAAAPGVQTAFIHNSTGKASEKYEQIGGFGYPLHLLESPAMLPSL